MNLFKSIRLTYLLFKYKGLKEIFINLDNLTELNLTSFQFEGFVKLLLMYHPWYTSPLTIIETMQEHNIEYNGKILKINIIN